MTLSRLVATRSAFPLLGAFGIYFLVGPLLPGAASWVVAGLIFAASVLVVYRHRGRTLLLGTGVLGLVLTYAGIGSGALAVLAVGLALLAIQIGVVIFEMVQALLRMRDVSPNAIAGAVCGYLLLGFLWAAVYGLVEIAQPGALTEGGQSIREQADPLAEIVYYSYVTLTTLGYGDVVPKVGLARSLAILEAVSGQLYIAILVAGLVGRFAAGNAPAPSPSETRSDGDPGRG